MFKKTTFALAGALGIVAAATLSTTAGAADTDAALVDNVKLYEFPDFNGLGVGATESVTAVLDDCQQVTVGAADVARSAELLNQEPGTALRVKLFADGGCTPEAEIVDAELNSGHMKDSGNPATGGTAELGTAGARSYKRVA